MLSKMKVSVGILIVIAGLAFWVSQSRHENTSTQQQLLFPSWQKDDAQIKAIDQLIISQGGDQLLLTKVDDNWVVNNGFYASIDPLFDLIQSFKNAEIVEAKTANSAKHAQLELANDDLQVSIYQAGHLSDGIHVGKKSSNGETFVRRIGEDQTYTARVIETISVEPNNWLLNTVLDIDANQIQSITFKPSDDHHFTVLRNSQTAVIELADTPSDLQLQSGADLTQLFSGLSRFMIDEAITAASWPIDKTEQSSASSHSVSYLLNSGAVIELNLFQQEGGYFLTIDSNLHPHYKGWVMKVAEYKFNALNRKLAEFTEPTTPGSQILDQAGVESTEESAN